jgi:hypothetical protein
MSRAIFGAAVSLRLDDATGGDAGVGLVDEQLADDVARYAEHGARVK